MEAIRAHVISPTLESYPSIRYVVVVGDDAQIPLYRQLDLAAIANEREFTPNSATKPGAMHAATAGGFYLTDDAYGTPPGAELGWRGRYFWRPLLATGRLVESPAEIQGMIDQYFAQPALESHNTLVTGYDFFSDTATLITAELSAMHHPLSPTTLIGEHWTADNLRDAWPNHPGGNAPDLASINAHAEHWRLEPADPTDTFYNTDIVNATASLSGTVCWSLGCHAGYSVPDQETTLAQSIPDFPQALAQQGATWIANTGYGYGTDDGIAGSERLMVLFTQALGGGGGVGGMAANAPLDDDETAVAVGEALRLAKVRYLQSLPAGGLTPYDAKSIMESTLYGLPMYRVEVPNRLSLRQTALAPNSHTQAELQTLSLLSNTLSLTPDLQRYSGATGDYYAVGAAINTQGAVGRPLLPVIAHPVTTYTGYLPHGALLLTATLSTTLGFNPVIVRPVTETAQPEPVLNPDLGWLPARPFFINRAGETPQLVATFALFNARTSELRLITSAGLNIYQALRTNDDYSAPSILSAEMRTFDEQTALAAQVFDAEGDVLAVYATFINDTQIWSVPLERDLEDVNGERWIGETSDVGRDTGYFIQAVDEAGNVGLALGKGEYLQAEPYYTLYLPLILRY